MMTWGVGGGGRKVHARHYQQRRPVPTGGCPTVDTTKLRALNTEQLIREFATREVHERGDERREQLRIMNAYARAIRAALYDRFA